MEGVSIYITNLVNAPGTLLFKKTFLSYACIFKEDAAEVPDPFASDPLTPDPLTDLTAT